MFQYITRGNQDPHGLPKVYFCSHAQDQAACLEPVAKQLLTHLSCAIFYTPDPGAARSPDFWEDMAQFQLLVIPVTTAFLTNDHPGMEEFRFAIRHHIPVLPLMQEQGLDALFNKQCGDLQYLDPTDSDPTAISYDEKLEKFLQTVLIGDETTKRIRQAFRTCLFLSYRKKDRRHAQRLMGLIHKQTSLRDVAIWYDEFLTPGENFNENIRIALEKSDLFVLAVTPNLVCETNYIMTTEYPMATAAGKPILPVELVETQLPLLQQHYPGLGIPIDANREDALHFAMSDALSKLALPEVSSSPERDYLIGLAYLGGVDVEVDHRRAVEMITACAQADLAEAIDKLADMYHNGIGVERNYETAIFWRKRLADHYRTVYDASPSKEAGFQYLSAQLALGEGLYNVRKLDEANEAFDGAVEFSFLFEDAFGRIYRTLRCRGLALGALGNITKDRGDPANAVSFHRMALRIATELSKVTDTLAARRDVIIEHFRIGDILRSDAKLSEALDHYTTALELSARLAADHPGTEPRQDLLVGHLSIGDIRMQMELYEEALADYTISLQLASQLAEEDYTELARLHLGVCHERLGNAYSALRDHSRALAHYRESLTLRWKLAEETGTVIAKHSVMISHLKLGVYLENNGEPSKALVHDRHALAIAEALSNDTQTLDALRHLSVCHGQLGSALNASGKPAEAAPHLKSALQLNLHLKEQTGTFESRVDLGTSYQHIGELYLKSGKYQEALQYLNEALEIRQTLAEESATPEDRRNLSVTFGSLGSVCLKLGKGDLSYRFFQMEQHLLEDLIKEKETPRLLQDLLLCHSNLGALFRRAKQPERALRSYRDAITVGKRLVQLDPSESIRRGLNLSNIHAGDLALSLGQTDKAVEHYTAALEISEKLSKETNSPAAWRDVLVAHLKLGELHQKAGTLSTALSHLREARHLGDLLAKESGSVQARQDQVIACNRLGDLYRSLQMLLDARMQYETALRIRQKLYEELKTADSADDLAMSHYTIGIGSTGTDRQEHLTMAYKLWDMLVRVIPDNPSYRRKRDIVRQYL